MRQPIRVSGRAAAWLRLLRAPNLLTVPGDPLAGFLLCAAIAPSPGLAYAIPCMVSAVLLYAAGLISNDCLDLEEDRRERPDRPLPSGRIDPATAWTAALVLIGCGIGAAAFAGTGPAVVAAALAGCVYLYNACAKRHEFFGPILLGLCRGLSFLMGAIAVDHIALRSPAILAALGGLILYVACVSRIARGETRAVFIGVGRYFPFVALAICFAALYGVGARDYEPGFAAYHAWLAASPALAALLLVRTYPIGKRLAGVPKPAIVVASIGAMLRGLLLFQAALCAMHPPIGLFAAAILLAGWPITAILGRRIQAS